LCLVIGVWLMFTLLTLGSDGGMADADHLIGALVLTFTVSAFAEIARPLRFLNMALDTALLITPFAYGADWLATVASVRRRPHRAQRAPWHGPEPVWLMEPGDRLRANRLMRR
jgi:hypothetical protein